MKYLHMVVIEKTYHRILEVMWFFFFFFVGGGGGRGCCVGKILMKYIKMIKDIDDGALISVRIS